MQSILKQELSNTKQRIAAMKIAPIDTVTKDVIKSLTLIGKDIGKLFETAQQSTQLRFVIEDFIGCRSFRTTRKQN